MPTQKFFKQRIRARMTKTGESYTAARRQLLRKATEPAAVLSAACPLRHRRSSPIDGAERT